MSGSYFFAYLSRMKLINRWSLMRNSMSENLQEHSHRVAILAHALATIGNVKFAKNWPAERAAFLALLHDASEVITGDMPTPVKYYDEAIRAAYKKIEQTANKRLLSFLPEEFRAVYESALCPDVAEAECWLLVQAADKLCAWLKCIEERRGGNNEFLLAEKGLREQLDNLKMDEINYFLECFAPGFSLTLDELN